MHFSQYLKIRNTVRNKEKKAAREKEEGLSANRQQRQPAIPTVNLRGLSIPVGMAGGCRDPSVAICLAFGSARRERGESKMPVP
jgi:hypothetical protein